MAEPVAYFITFHTYGSRLHGHEAGSVDYQHRDVNQPVLPPDPIREATARRSMLHSRIALDHARREAVIAAVIETCRYRGWQLHAVHARTTHVHAVVTAPNTAAEKTLADLKAYATRRLRNDALLAADAPAWSEHGSTRYLWDETEVTDKAHYTLFEQGQPMSRWPSTTVELSEHEA